MLRKIDCTFGIVLPLLFAACSGSVGGSAKDGSGGAGGADDSAGGGPTAGNGGSSTDLKPLPPGAPCRVAVPMRRITETQYRNAMKDIWKGQVSMSATFGLPTIGKPESGFTTDPTYNSVDLAATRAFNTASIDIPLAVVDKLATLLPCSSTPSDACAQTFIDTYGKLAFRRPLTTDEKATLMKAFRLGTGADAFKDGIAAVTSAILQSPQFLYDYEVGQPEVGGKVLKLNSYETASRLAFMLWDSFPDDALLTAAASNSLDTNDGVRAAATKMLGDARARAPMIRFAREWTHLEIPKVGERFDKAYTQQLADAIQSEFDAFVGDTFLAQDGSIKKLFTSSAPFGNATVAKFYQGGEGTGPRSGLLTQPAFLTGIASPAETSPIRRSVFIRHQVTCEDFPPPPANAAAAEAMRVLPPDATQREKSVERVKDPKCGGCHSRIDPLGFGFESFDELGRFRTKTATGKSIDAHGEFIEPPTDDLKGGFNTVAELGARLADSPTVHSCLARQLFRFSYGRMDGDADSCSIENMAKKAATANTSLRDFVLGFVSADEFRFRRIQ